MTSEVTVDEINRDIAALYEKIERCNKSKVDLEFAIQKEKEIINDLNFYIRDEVIRNKKHQRNQYDIPSLNDNITRCMHNITTFEDTIAKEDKNIASMKNMISILTEDLARPKEIVFDAKTGQVISK